MWPANAKKFPNCSFLRNMPFRNHLKSFMWSLKTLVMHGSFFFKWDLFPLDAFFLFPVLFCAVTNVSVNVPTVACQSLEPCSFWTLKHCTSRTSHKLLYATKCKCAVCNECWIKQKTSRNAVCSQFFCCVSRLGMSFHTLSTVACLVLLPQQSI